MRQSWFQRGHPMQTSAKALARWTAANDETAPGWITSTRPWPTRYGLATQLSRGAQRAYVHTKDLGPDRSQIVSIVFDDRGVLLAAFRYGYELLIDAPDREAQLCERIRLQHLDVTSAVLLGRIAVR